MDYLESDVLVVGGGTGGTAAAIQAARRGARVILVSEFYWLGGMLTAAGVSAPDGNELEAFQTGLWGAFLRELRQRQVGGLDHGWVSFFTYHPKTGADIFAEWVAALPNLKWIAGQVPREVKRVGDRLASVRFDDYQIQATIIIDGTELGDVLALADVLFRWGWEFQDEFDEPSAPLTENALTRAYPVQTPTWVVMMRDFGEQHRAPEIHSPSTLSLDAFEGFADGYEANQFLNYGRLPGDRFMINWPQNGNDYGDRLTRLMDSLEARQEFFQEARDYSHAFAHAIQHQLGGRYGLATDMFPSDSMSMGGGAFALCPYIRESRRLVGMTTIREQDVLPQNEGNVAKLPVNDDGRCDAIAIGNYPNDHHYPAPESAHLTLAPKAIRWGGRWTGTPFTIPYRSLVPAQVDGLLVCEKNISVSHIANGATRLQPVVLSIGQAAGMAAALCIEHQCQPRALSVEKLQEALLTDAIAPTPLVPLFTTPPDPSQWIEQQRHYLKHPDLYPVNGYASGTSFSTPLSDQWIGGQAKGDRFTGKLQHNEDGCYHFEIHEPLSCIHSSVNLVTLNSDVNQALQHLPKQCKLVVIGTLNTSGHWLLAKQFQYRSPF